MKLFISLILLTGSAFAQLIDYKTQLKNKPAQVGFPAISDNIQYVSPNGSDLSDGLSWATAKLSCSAAISAIGSSNIGIIYESPALASDCIAATGASTNFNGWIYAPSRFYVGPLAQAKAITTGVDSTRVHLVGSVWSGLAAVDDFWDVYVNSFSGAYTSGSNLIITHSSVEGGAGRVLFLTDAVVANPRDATAPLNSNSFAFDNQGAYYESGSQGMLWEMANTVSCDGCALGSTIFRQNWVPIFNSVCAGCQAEFALGGSGTLGVSGNYSGAPKWLFTNLRGSTFNTITITHSATAPRVFTVVDADSNTIRPSTAGSHQFATGISALGIVSYGQPAFTDISGTATAAQVTAAGSVGQIQFNNTTLGADSNLNWDNTNKRLGIGQATPLVPFHVKTTGAGGWPQYELENTATGGASWFFGGTDNGNGAGGGKFLIHHTNSSTGSEFTIDSATANVGISNVSPAFTLDVGGRINTSSAYLYNGLVATAGKYLKSDGSNGYRDSTGSASGVGACAGSRWASTLNADAAPTCTQPAFTDISGSVAASQLPNPSASTLGGIRSLAAVSHKWINTISTLGVPSATQPDVSDLTGQFNTGTGTTGALPKFTNGATGAIGNSNETDDGSVFSSSLLVAMNASNDISVAPASAGSQLGWKQGYYSNLYAVGIANFTEAHLVGTGGSWFSLFDGASLPANDGTATVPDTHAFFSVAANSGEIQTSGKLSKYNKIATVGNGVAAEYNTIDLTGQTANIGATTLYTVPSSGAGMYRVSTYVTETTAGSLSSTLPNIQIIYTDKDSSTSITIDATPVLGAAGIGQTGALTANTVGTTSTGVIPISAKASTTIQYQAVNYSSNLAGMTYALHIKIEAM